MVPRWIVGLATAPLLASCSAPHDDAQPSAPQSLPASAPAPESAPAVEAPIPPPTAPGVEAASFDPLTVMSAEVRIVVVHDLGGPPCGILHSVGAIEVEALGVGSPAPRLGLYVSCPADLQPRGMLAVGKTLRVTLHRGKQAWPRPATRLPEALAVRYVRSIKEGRGPGVVSPTSF